MILSSFKSLWDSSDHLYTAVLRAVLPCTHEKITIFRGALESIGLQVKAQRTYELADGSEVKMDSTTGDIEFMGEIVGGTIIFGDPGTEPILGVTALASVGIDIDPRSQQLKKLPATRLKKLMPKSNKSLP